MTLGISSSRFGRASLACLALFANLIATGVPVLHALAHELAAEDHHAEMHLAHAEGPSHSHETGSLALARAALDHTEDEPHVRGLHDESRPIEKKVYQLFPALPPERAELVSSEVHSAPIVHPVAPVASRAPPAPTAARAPPHA